MQEEIYLPVSLKLIQWNKKVAVDGEIKLEPKQCYAHTTSQGRKRNVLGTEINTTTTCKINDVDMTQKSAGIDYAKWYWDMNSDMFNALNQAGFGSCYIRVTYDGGLDNIINEELVSTEEFKGLQSPVTSDEYMQARASI